MCWLASRLSPPLGGSQAADAHHKYHQQHKTEQSYAFGWKPQIKDDVRPPLASPKPCPCRKSEQSLQSRSACRATGPGCEGDARHPRALRRRHRAPGNAAASRRARVKAIQPYLPSLADLLLMDSTARRTIEPPPAAHASSLDRHSDSAVTCVCADPSSRHPHRSPTGACPPARRCIIADSAAATLMWSRAAIKAAHLSSERRWRWHAGIL